MLVANWTVRVVCLLSIYFDRLKQPSDQGLACLMNDECLTLLPYFEYFSIYSFNNFWFSNFMFHFVQNILCCVSIQMTNKSKMFFKVFRNDQC
jgi:hypothetical protein